jgi:hypothetical protein
MKTGLVVLASVLTAATAHAEKVGIVVTGEATLQPQLASQLERWLHDRGRTFVPGALAPDAVNTLIDCFVLEDIGCARGVVDARSTSRSLIYARVEHTQNPDGTRDVSVTGHWFQKNAEPVAERRLCKQCTDATLVDTVNDLMLALVHEPPVGTDSPAPAPTAPTTSTATAVPARTTTDSEGSSRRLLPIGLIGAGAAALLGGVVMFAIDEDADPSKTTNPTFRDTATGGVILGAAGAAALGVGLYLWFSDKGGSHPVAAVGRDGGVVGWAGRF